jgi:hypothetical protein
MTPQESTPEKQRERLAQEQIVIDAMIGIYCKGMKHERFSNSLCPTCSELQRYTVERNKSCPFLASRSFCQFCAVHCYSPEKRETIREVMRYAGPRMLWHHPIYAIKHLVEVRRQRRAR